MRADNCEPINVLNAFRGFLTEKLKHQITPYRFEGKDGSVQFISEIRVVHRTRSGRKDQIHFDVQTKDDLFCRLLFDTHTFYLAAGRSEGFLIVTTVPPPQSRLPTIHISNPVKSPVYSIP